MINGVETSVMVAKSPGVRLLAEEHEGSQS